VMTAYGLATHGWMIYAFLAIGAFGGIAMPAIQGLISRSLPPNEQGSVQGALSSLASVTGILGPPLATGLFGYFVSPRAPVILPGIAFFVGSGVVLCALLLAVRSLRRAGRSDSIQ
jgi:DHA1 family tetracycline resistance protein-like MFS transporter